MQKNEHSPVARGLMKLMERLGEKYQIDQMSGAYAFTGREALTPAQAVELYEELRTIDKLIEQLREAMKSARLAILDLESLSDIAGEEGMLDRIEELNELQRRVEEFVRQEAERQGLERTKDGYRLTPKSYALVRGRLLSEIFSDLQAARSGRHDGPVMGEGAVETAKTKGYEFGDSIANMDVAGTFVNAAIRAGTRRSGAGTSGRGEQSAFRRCRRLPSLPLVHAG
jgi:uncharacterized protein with von Willebrand factor type A (vWA) domain